MRHWIKLWTEMLDDPKMGRLTDRQHRLCTNLFCLAGIIDDDGRLLGTADIAYKVRRSDIDALVEDLRALAAVNIIELVDDAYWQLVHFQVRNERPPSAAPEAVKERVDRYREKKRDGNEVVTTLQETVTNPQRGVTPPDQIRSDQTRQEADQKQNRSEADPLAVVAALARAGINESTVTAHVQEWPHPEHAAALVAHALADKRIKNRAGFVIDALRKGWTPPPDSRKSNAEWLGYDPTGDPPEPSDEPPPDPPLDVGDAVPFWPESMRGRMDPRTFDNHFRDSRARFVDGKIIISLLPSSLEMVERRLRPTVEQVLAEYGKTVVMEAIP